MLTAPPWLTILCRVRRAARGGTASRKTRENTDRDSIAIARQGGGGTLLSELRAPGNRR
jgi:hypothetical protein